VSSVQTLNDFVAARAFSSAFDRFTNAVYDHAIYNFVLRIPQLFYKGVYSLFPDLVLPLRPYLFQLVTVNILTEEEIANDPKLSRVMGKIKQFSTGSFNLSIFNTPRTYAAYSHDVIYVSPSFLDLPEKALEFGSAHELGHHHLNHQEECRVLDCIIAAIGLYYLANFYFFSYVALECFAFITEQLHSQMQEHQADLFAIELLGTNQGAVQFFKIVMEEKVNRYLSLANVSLDRYSLTESERLALCQVGNNYSQISHPSLWERYTNALDYQPPLKA